MSNLAIISASSTFKINQNLSLLTNIPVSTLFLASTISYLDYYLWFELCLLLPPTPPKNYAKVLSLSSKCDRILKQGIFVTLCFTVTKYLTKL
jgi:hypothetical protein